METIKSSNLCRIRFNPVALIVLHSLIIFIWYLYHLAPDILWNDTCKLSVQSYLRDYTFSPGGHALRNFLGALWGELGFRNYIYGQNLFSAVTSLFTCITLGVTLRLLSFRLLVIIPTLYIMSLAHTIWFLSEIAESYSLLLFLFSLMVFLYFYIDRTRRKISVLTLLVVIEVLSILNHQLATLFIILPVGALFKINVRERKRIVYSTLAIGGIVLVTVLFKSPGFFSEHLFSITASINRFIYPKIFLRECIKIPLYLAVNFPWISFVIGMIGIKSFYTKTTYDFYILLAQFLLVALFSSSYGMGRKFFLLIPCYYVFSIFVAFGCDVLRRKVDRKAFIAVMTVAVLAHPLTYYIGYLTLNKLQLDPITKRKMPFRDSNRFYLWPGKGNAYEPRIYTDNVINTVPKMLCCSWTGKFTRYLGIFGM